MGVARPGATAQGPPVPESPGAGGVPLPQRV